MIRYRSDEGVNLGDLNRIEIDRGDDPVVLELLDVVRRMQREREESVDLNVEKLRGIALEVKRRFETIWCMVGGVPSIDYMMPEKGRMPARKDVARLLNDLKVSTRRLEVELEWDGANR